MSAIPGNGPVRSTKFQDEDADLSFVSSDGIIFKIHSRNLECNCAGFAPAGFDSSVNEEIPLQEDSMTLEFLFAFVYPREQPDLGNVDINLLLKLAEAAEKYQVFGALNVSGIRLREQVHNSPLKVLIHGFKHDRRDLLLKAVPFLEDTPLATMATQLPPALLPAWVKYYEARRKKIMQAFSEPSFVYMPSPNAPAAPTQHPSNTVRLSMSLKRDEGLQDRIIADAMRKFYGTSSATTSVKGLRTAIREAFRSEPETRTIVDSDISRRMQGLTGSLAEESGVKEFLRRLEENLDKIPPFDSFIRS